MVSLYNSTSNPILKLSFFSWPGNLSNMIDPVTIKIVEKPDVSCNQDHTDVRPLPMFQIPENKEDYKITKVEPAENLAPADVDYAYTGQIVKYGAASEKVETKNSTSIKKNLVPKTAPLPKYLEEHVLRTCRGESLDKSMNPRFSLSRSNSETSVEDEELKILKQTVENIQEPSVPVRPKWLVFEKKIVRVKISRLFLEKLISTTLTRNITVRRK